MASSNVTGHNEHLSLVLDTVSIALPLLLEIDTHTHSHTHTDVMPIGRDVSPKALGGCWFVAHYGRCRGAHDNCQTRRSG